MPFARVGQHVGGIEQDGRDEPQAAKECFNRSVCSMQIAELTFMYDFLGFLFFCTTREGETLRLEDQSMQTRIQLSQAHNVLSDDPGGRTRYRNEPSAVRASKCFNHAAKLSLPRLSHLSLSDGSQGLGP